jgi:hypothetical protein
LESNQLPPSNPFFANAPDKNFEIAILLKIIQRSYNKTLVSTQPPQGPGAGVVSYAQGVYMVLMEGMLE